MVAEGGIVGRRIGGAGGGSDPGKGKGTGTLVAATAFVLVVAGGTTGAISIGGGATGSGTAVDSAFSRDLNTRKNAGKKSAKKGRADEAWNRLGLRSIKKTLKSDVKCLAASTDKVREFLLRTPCESLTRSLLLVGDDRGNTAAISVVWVSFHDRADATAFERVERVHGNGDIKPLAPTALNLADVRFTGHHFDSCRDGRVVTVAEAEIMNGHLDNTDLDVLTEVAVWLPNPDAL
ncbi:hypothetical protein SAMN04489729_6011 [Amycolatopsis lurida]|nr:hypothetical protein SAMN04489729_6011 [Amycolatopsis lurida]